MGLLKQLMIFGKSGLQGLPTRVTLPLRGTGLLLSPVSPKGLLGPPTHNMGLCSRPGQDPNACKQFGPDADPGNRASA
jgi:hypothetical protein